MQFNLLSALPVIRLADAVVYPNAMVVKYINALVTGSAVLASLLHPAADIAATSGARNVHRPPCKPLLNSLTLQRSRPGARNEGKRVNGIL